MPGSSPSSSSYDPTVWFDMFRSACGPMLRFQEEGLHALDRFTRLQHEFLADWLESNRQHARALLEARSPADFLRAESELAAKFGEKVRAHAEEFLALTSQAQNAFGRTGAEAAMTSGEAARKATSEVLSSVIRTPSEVAKESPRSEAPRTEAPRRPS